MPFAGTFPLARPICSWGEGRSRQQKVPRETRKAKKNVTLSLRPAKSSPLFVT